MVPAERVVILAVSDVRPPVTLSPLLPTDTAPVKPAPPVTVRPL